MKDKRLGNPLQRQGVQNTVAAVIAILIGMLVGLIVLLFTDASRAGEGMLAILTGGLTDLKNMGQVLYYATPLIMTGLSVGFAKKTGLFNIGAPGQYMWASSGPSCRRACTVLPPLWPRASLAPSGASCPACSRRGGESMRSSPAS